MSKKEVLIISLILAFIPILVNAQSVADLELDTTFQSISVRSSFSGDALTEDNILLEYKKSDETEWKLGHPLAIIPTDRIMGSIFYLEEGTEYDVRVTIKGCIDTGCTKNDSITTRLSVFPTGSGNDIYVSPDGDDGSSGTQAEPYETIQKAADVAQAGDVVHIMPGTYHEAVSVGNSGTVSEYILFMAEADVKLYGSVAALELTGQDQWEYDSGSDSYKTNIGFRTYHVSYEDQRLFNYHQSSYSFNDFVTESLSSNGISGGYWSEGVWLYVKIPDGSDPDTHEMHVGSLAKGISLDSKSHIIFDGLEIAYYGIDNYGTGIDIKESSNIIVRNCIIHNQRTDIRIRGENAHDNLVEDNELYDTTLQDWDWDMNKRHDTEGSGVSMAGGGGNVIRRNTVHGPFNGIAASTWGYLEDENYNYNCDIYENYLYDVTDDGLEPEGTHINFRMWNNTFKDVFHPISLAPITRGPLYVFRNRILNALKSPLKYSNDFSGRVYVYHNSAYILDETRNALNPSGKFGNVVQYNNIFFGHRYSFENTYGLTAPVDWDYDCLHTTGRAPDHSHWIKWNNQRYSTIEDFRAATGQEMNGTSDDPKYVNIESYNINLQSDSPCIDTGVFIPNINDWNYLGSAPDIGAIEFDSGSAQGCIDNDGDSFGANPNNDCDDTRIDCDDIDEEIFPGAVEVCDDNDDNDCDYLEDCEDPDCVNEASCAASCDEADTDLPFNEISNQELISFIEKWKLGQGVSIEQLMDAIHKWKNGCE